MGFLNDLVDGITGKGGADASKEAAQLQYQATQDALEFQREALAQQTELTQPFVDLGANNVDRFQRFLTAPAYNTFDILREDPYGADYLANNPLFDASVENANRAITAGGAARGRFVSGDTTDALFRNYLAMGDQFFGNYLNRHSTLGQQQISNAMMPVQLGQAAAAGQAANVGQFGANAANLTTQGGNALAAGQVGAANAYGQAANNLLQTGLMAFALSDEREKEILSEEGADADGITFYRFKYKGGAKEYIGRMAQDIQKVHPDAVIQKDDGTLMVRAEYAPVAA